MINPNSSSDYIELPILVDHDKNKAIGFAYIAKQSYDDLCKLYEVVGFSFAYNTDKKVIEHISIVANTVESKDGII